MGSYRSPSPGLISLFFAIWAEDLIFSPSLYIFLVVFLLLQVGDVFGGGVIRRENSFLILTAKKNFQCLIGITVGKFSCGIDPRVFCSFIYFLILVLLI